ncbi:MAG: hypothetical protein J0H26_13245, partial [Alphaproteobacteria bacterium]|nr:hypothetical protein [Alphaproteobacteria bacterium]
MGPCRGPTPEAPGYRGGLCFRNAGGRATDDAIRSPGQLQSHYAPRASLRLNASAAEAGEVLLVEALR